jgi:hypothetical protein
MMVSPTWAPLTAMRVLALDGAATNNGLLDFDLPAELLTQIKAWSEQVLANLPTRQTILSRRAISDLDRGVLTPTASGSVASALGERAADRG